jgi:cytochrome c2
MLFLTVTGLITMFEVLGRREAKFNIERLKRIHSINGWIYVLVFLFIAYFCLSFIVSSKSELSPRGTFHSVFALTIAILFVLKLLITRIYRQFYNEVKTIGLIMALLTFGLVGLSGGYYFLITSFGTDTTFDKIMQYKRKGIAVKEIERNANVEVGKQGNSEHIMRGNTLFNEKCSFCHNDKSTDTIVGPGLKGVLKNPKLPVSGKPATRDNIRMQLRKPFNLMPSFDYLSEEEVEDVIAYLSTL